MSDKNKQERKYAFVNTEGALPAFDGETYEVLKEEAGKVFINTGYPDGFPLEESMCTVQTETEIQANQESSFWSDLRLGYGIPGR